VRVKLAAYPFQKYGVMEGRVKTISADASPAAAASPDPARAKTTAVGDSFKALLELHDQKLVVDRTSLPLAAGMRVSAEILEGKRTVLEYVLSPVQRVADEAARER
jgi:HlyD family secretion protein